MKQDRRTSFKQIDVTRALKGALAADLQPTACHISPDGKIHLKFGGASTGQDDEPNPWDEVLR